MWWKCVELKLFNAMDPYIWKYIDWISELALSMWWKCVELKFVSSVRWSCEYIKMLCRGWGRDICMGCSKLCVGDTRQWSTQHHWDYWAWWGFCSGSVYCFHTKESTLLHEILWGLYLISIVIKQVTFVTGEHLPPEFSHVLKFGDVSYNLYSNSFLQLGLVSCVHKYVSFLSIIYYEVMIVFLKLHTTKFNRSIEQPAPYPRHALCSFKCSFAIIF
jgi:hypothetical protein